MLSGTQQDPERPFVKRSVFMHLSRRDFLKTAGVVAGASALCSFLPGVAYAADGAVDKTGIGASAVASPSFAWPALVLPGQPIPCKSTGAASIDKAWLQHRGGGEPVSLDHYLEKMLNEDGSSPEFLAAAKPLEPGLYDLFVTAGRGGKQRTERQPNAVAVFDSFPRDFRFGVISDVHFGDFRIGHVLPDFDTAAAVRREIGILNDSGVQFCLCCGDLCNIPPKTKNELLEYVDMLENHARFPVLSVPGNHDGYAAGAGGGKITSDTFEHWTRNLGSLTGETRFGDMSLIGINTYEKPAAQRNIYGGLGQDMDLGALTDAQLANLDAALARGAQTPGATIVFGHHNPTNTVEDKNGMFTIKPFSETGRAECLALLEKHRPEVMFCGHVHGIFEETHAATRILTAPTAGSVPYDNSHPIGLLIVTVKNAQIASVETVEIARVS